MASIRSSLVLQDGMTKVLNHINKAMGLTLNSFEAIQKASGKSFNTANIAAMRNELGAANASMNEMEQSYRDCEGGQKNLNKRINEGQNATDGLLNKVKGIASTYLGMKAAKGSFELSDTITQTNARLNMMNDGLQTTDELNDMIYASAQRSRGSYLETADAVSKLGLMAGDAFSDNKETIAFMEQVNKQFKIAGTEASGIDAAMLQLTQAMGSGVLRGEEYNSILEQAPNIIQSIADYMNVPKGKLKDMAAEGKITADIVKAAMFAASDETNAKFESMPKTWSDIWTSMKNRVIKALNPVLTKINQLANSEIVQSTVDGLINAFSVISGVLTSVFDKVCDVYNFVADNWSQISPIVNGIVSVLAVLVAVILAYKVCMLLATAAQWLYNTALFGCPLVWILAIIIIVIAAIYGIIAVINKVTGSTISATGVIMGALAVAGAFIWDLFLGLLDLVLGIINYWVNPFIAFANFFGNLFNDPIGAVIHLFGDLADNVLGVIQKIASALDFVFGSNMADTVQGWRDGLSTKVDNMAKEYGNGEYEQIMSALDLSVDDLGLKRIEYSDAWSAGYSAGENIESGIDDFFNFDGLSDFENQWDPVGYGGVLDDISESTDETAQNTGKNTEELSYLRDIAEREAINRFTTAEVKIDMTGMTNRIDSSMDLDGVLTTLTEGFAEALEISAEGVHV